MGDKWLISEDPLYGTRTFYHTAEDGKFGVSTEYDATPTVEANRAQYNASEKTWKGEGNHHVASLPLPLYFDLKNKGVLDDWPSFRRWLNDADNRFFRVKPGHL